MKERPIPFSDPMVKAILEGRKTMTRIVVKPQPEMVFEGESLPDGNSYGGWEPKLPPWSQWPYQIGMLLWVRETLKRMDTGTGVHAPIASYSMDDKIVSIRDRKSPVGCAAISWRWKRNTLSSRFMPRAASRITLEITGVRVERLNHMNDDDAIKEGFRWSNEASPLDCFMCLWNKLNGTKHPWASDPRVWVIEFKKL